MVLLDKLLEASAYFLLVTPAIFVIAGIILSLKTRFIQFRALPTMFRGLGASLMRKPVKDKDTILAHRALFTAMSTVIGISSMVTPVLAIRIAGPGVLFGYFIATILGSCINFVEVTFALSYRKHLPDGTIMGGPMQYLKDAISPFLALWYAVLTTILLVFWTAFQSGNLAGIFSSHLLGPLAIPKWTTGIGLAIGVCIVLFGGIKRIGEISAKFVPFMFCLYCGAALWIVLYNIDMLPSIFSLILTSAFKPITLGTGLVIGGAMQTIRWGVIKGIEGNEAGMGTSTIPHSMAVTKVPTKQGILAMASVYSQGIVVILSGLVTLITGTWQDPNIAFGINIVAESFAMYFSHVGTFALVVCSFLFAFGTILGNCYNGSQCFLYITNNKYITWYYLLAASFIFLGSVVDLLKLLTFNDIIAMLVALPHIIAIVILAFKRADLLKVNLKNSSSEREPTV